MRAKETRDSSIVGGGDGGIKEEVAECVDGWKCGRVLLRSRRQPALTRRGVMVSVFLLINHTVLLQCLEGGTHTLLRHVWFFLFSFVSGFSSH